MRRFTRYSLYARVGSLMAAGAAILMFSVLFSGCGGGGFTRPTETPNGSVNMTFGSQVLTLANVHEAYDSADQTTVISADDSTPGKLDTPGQHQMQLSFPGHSTGTWTLAQGCTFGMNMGMGMESASDMRVTCTQYPGVGGDITGTFIGSINGNPVSGTFYAKRSQ